MCNRSYGVFSGVSAVCVVIGIACMVCCSERIAFGAVVCVVECVQYIGCSYVCYDVL